ncbi:SsgA family sporulation/cell division regulator [Streptomyces sp. NPDC005808]|uniref:SsgA family sporulation/cell division regulator n=1 Tax=Streptomyces sp. NPDC005808 TaxID=3364734 RepID=UPI0036B8B29B
MPPDAPFIDQALLRRVARLNSAHGERSLARTWLVHVGTDECLSWPHAMPPTADGWPQVLYTGERSETEDTGHLTAPMHYASREPDLDTLRAPRPARRVHPATDRAAHNEQHTTAADSTDQKLDQHDTANARIESRHGTVHASITALLCPSGDISNPLPLPTHLNYRETDPYAVEAVFGFGLGPHQVTWTFARDLLTDGLHGKTGSGDISIWTSACDEGQLHTFIQLKSPTGTALLSLPRTPVKEFLAETTRMVARGSEHALLSSSLNDLEAQLNRLSAFPGRGD